MAQQVGRCVRVILAIFATSTPLIRWTLSRSVRKPESTIASYFSSDMRNGGPGNHADLVGGRGGGHSEGRVVVDILESP